ncbi:MAG: DM13 domain-containing protein [Burkholderiales bacterium]|nr:DM13 domain-containing protein [Anaerolineae bacterium]
MNTRLRLIVIVFGALFVLATYTFPFWQPFLMIEPVEQGFPGLPENLQASFQTLPTDQRATFLTMAEDNQEMALGMLIAALSAPVEVPLEQQSLPEMDGPVVVATGSFTRIDPIRWADGRVTIYQLADNRKIMRFEGFTSANGPDLRVVLSANPEPRTRAEVEEDDANINLGRLLGNFGSQNYEIPPEIDIAQYGSVVIYSQSFDTVFSTAELS